MTLRTAILRSKRQAATEPGKSGKSSDDAAAYVQDASRRYGNPYIHGENNNENNNDSPDKPGTGDNKKRKKANDNGRPSTVERFKAVFSNNVIGVRVSVNNENVRPSSADSLKAVFTEGMDKLRRKKNKKQQNKYSIGEVINIDEPKENMVVSVVYSVDKTDRYYYGYIEKVESTGEGVFNITVQFDDGNVESFVYPNVGIKLLADQETMDSYAIDKKLLQGMRVGIGGFLGTVGSLPPHTNGTDDINVGIVYDGQYNKDLTIVSIGAEDDINLIGSKATEIFIWKSESEKEESDSGSKKGKAGKDKSKKKGKAAKDKSKRGEKGNKDDGKKKAAKDGSVMSTIEETCPEGLTKYARGYFKVRGMVDERVASMVTKKLNEMISEIASDSDVRESCLQDQEDLFHHGYSDLKQAYDEMKNKVEKKIDEHCVATLNDFRRELCNLLGVTCNGQFVLKRDDTDNEATNELEARYAKLEEKMRKLELSEAEAKSEEEIEQQAREAVSELGEPAEVQIEEESKAAVSKYRTLDELDITVTTEI